MDTYTLRALNKSGTRQQVLIEGMAVGVIWRTTVTGGGRGGDTVRYSGWAWQRYTGGNWDGQNLLATKAEAVRLVLRPTSLVMGPQGQDSVLDVASGRHGEVIELGRNALRVQWYGDRTRLSGAQWLPMGAVLSYRGGTWRIDSTFKG